MQQVTGSKKNKNGVQVSSSYADDNVVDFFTFEELVDQKIDARDLLAHPRLYRVDTIGHTIESSA